MRTLSGRHTKRVIVPSRDSCPWNRLSQWSRRSYGPFRTVSTPWVIHTLDSDSPVVAVPRPPPKVNLSPVTADVLFTPLVPSALRRRRNAPPPLLPDGPGRAMEDARTFPYHLRPVYPVIPEEQPGPAQVLQTFTCCSQFDGLIPPPTSAVSDPRCPRVPVPEPPLPGRLTAH